MRPASRDAGGMMSRIGFDARYINDRYHGVGRYAFRLLEALAHTDPETTYVVYRGRGTDQRFDWQLLAASPNIELHDGPWPLYWPTEQLAWPPILSQHRIDLFHSPYFVAPLFWQPPSVPVITTIHDLIFERYPEYMPMRWTRPYYRFLMRLSLRRASRIVCVSRSTATDLREYYHLDPAHITVISEAADPIFSAERNEPFLEHLRGSYQLTLPIVLNVGARRPHKNLRRLVTAFSSIADQVPHQLIFIGPPDNRFPDEATLEAAALGMGNRVRFLDWVPESHLPALYRLADVVVLPSLIEGFGLPALEAMACGAPVIAACGSSYPEVVGEAGILVEPSDVDQIAQALRSLLLDPDLRQRYQEAGLRQSSRFSWEISARQVISSYAELLT